MAVNDSNLQATIETDAGYGQLFAVLLRRRFWLLGVFCLVLPIAILNALNKPPVYESSMQLLVESNYQEKQEGKEVAQEFADSSVEIDYATQLNLMRSSNLVQQALDLLSPEYPDIKVDDFTEDLNVSQLEEGKDQETKIFEIVYTSDDPLKTQKALEAIQRVYQDYNLEQQKLRLSEGLAFINKQLPEARQNLVRAETALEQFRKNHNVIDPTEEAKAVSETLESIKSERQKIKADYQEAQASYNTRQQQLELSPQDALIASRLSQSSRYQALLDELQKTELALAEQRTTFTDEAPNVQQLLEQRQSQLTLLQGEVERVLGGTPIPSNISEEGLLREGQLVETDQKLAEELLTLQKQLLALQARDQSLAQTEQQLRGELARLPQLIADYNRLQPEVEIQSATLQRLLEAQQKLGIEIARGGFKWQVVEAPELGEQTGPNTKVDILLGVIVGLFLGGVAAFVREAVDDSVHTADDLKKQVAVPLLGIVPGLPLASASRRIINLPFGKPKFTAPSLKQTVYWLPFRESLDLIYKNIQLLHSGSDISSLVVTSALAGEGKSTLVMGLALSAARLHQKVLLIDANLRHPMLHIQLDLPNEEGLSTLLADETTVPSPVRISPAGSNIDILTAGPIPTDPVMLLSSPRMKELMAKFEQTYDLVLLDTSPILGKVDAIEAASCCSGVVMVGRIDMITQSELMEAMAMLGKFNVIGMIANDGRKAKDNSAAYVEQYNSSSLRVYKPPIDAHEFNHNGSSSIIKENLALNTRELGGDK
ncbi:MAG: polysaccharide biosynthesis tyrosine autokinase [Symploca sp. SIO2G7]|nr:polysaccharide biosynthesis tyrosine autokinase [Symploca sp. SIO2G7]